MPKLEIKWSDKEESKELVGELTTIGRIAKNTIQLKDIKISREHCQIIKIAEGYKIIDLGSSNGTSVNGALIKEQLLQDKDKIKLGDIEITFLAEDKVNAEIIVPEQIIEPSAVEVPEVISEPVSETSLPQQPLAKPESPAQTTAPVSKTEPVAPDKEEQSIGEKTVLIPPAPPKPKTSPVSRFSKLKTLPKKGKKTDQIDIKKQGAAKFSRTSRWKKMTKPEATESEQETDTKEARSKTYILFVVGGLISVGIIVSLVFVLKPPVGLPKNSSLEAQEELISQAEEFEKEGYYQRALDKYKEFLVLYGDSKDIQLVKKDIERLEKRLTLLREAPQKWAYLNKKIDETKIAEFPPLVKEVQSFITAYAGTPEAKEAEGKIEMMQRSMGSSGPENNRFAEVKLEVEHTLIPQKDFESALLEWNNFLEKFPEMNDAMRNKVKIEKQRINRLKQEQEQ